MKYTRDLEVKYTADIVVIGGGPAGVAAAVTAARQGKSVIIIEQSGCFGGMGTIGLVPEMMCFDDGINLLTGGFGKEIKETLFDDVCDYKCYNVRVEEVKRLYDDKILESGVKPLLFTTVTDVVVKDDVIEYAVVSSRSGVYAIAGKTFIDCTGSGDICVKAGEEFEYGDHEGVAMPATLCSFWSGIDFDKKVKPDGCRVGEAYVKGILSQYDLLLPGIKEVDKATGVGGGNIGHAFALDDTDEEKLTETMIKQRKIVNEYVDYYRTYIPGCENANLCFTSTVLGVRESRRIKGVYITDHKDYLTRAIFDDEIGRYNYPVDIHPKAADDESARQFVKDTEIKYSKGESYGISLRCLIPLKTKNLFMAGKCISASREMQASMRVIPCCFITGQAVGVAAAVCVEDGSDNKNVNVKKVQKLLKDMGAYLPNYKN